MLGGLLLGGGLLASGIGLGSTLFGKSPEQRAKEALYGSQNYGIGQGDFLAPGLQGGIDQRGVLANQLGNRQWDTSGASMHAGTNPFIQQLQNQFAGNGPGQEIARMQAQQATQAGIQNQLAMAASARGNPLAARTAATQSANLSAQGGQNATMGGLQAQQMAGSLLGNQLNAANQFNLQNRQMELSSRFNFADLNDRSRMAALQQQAMLQQLQQGGMANYQNARLNRLGMEMGAAGQPNKSQQFQAGMMGIGSGLMGAGFGLLGQPSAPAGYTTPNISPPGLTPVE